MPIFQSAYHDVRRIFLPRVAKFTHVSTAQEDAVVGQYSVPRRGRVWSMRYHLLVILKGWACFFGSTKMTGKTIFSRKGG